eukprot:391454_1
MCVFTSCRNGPCQCITLVIWWICGGFILGCFWFLFGLICCCIPGIGKSARNIGKLCFDPLSHRVELDLCDGVCCLCENMCNAVWLICCGWAMALGHIISAILCLPFYLCCLDLSLIHLRLAKLSLWPIGFELQLLEQSDASDYGV